MAAPVNTASPITQHLQSPWDAAVPSASQPIAIEQQQHQQQPDAETEVAQFAASPSPVPDSPNSSRGGSHVDQAGDRPAELQQSGTVELLGSSKQQPAALKDGHPLLRQQPRKVRKFKMHDAVADTILVAVSVAVLGQVASVCCFLQPSPDKQFQGVRPTSSGRWRLITLALLSLHPLADWRAAAGQAPAQRWHSRHTCDWRNHWGCGLWR